MDTAAHAGLPSPIRLASELRTNQPVKAIVGPFQCKSVTNLLYCPRYHPTQWPNLIQTSIYDKCSGSTEITFSLKSNQPKFGDESKMAAQHIILAATLLELGANAS